MRTSELYSRQAVRILAEVAAAPPSWYDTFAAWVTETLGEPPDRSVGSRAREEWDCAALGGLFAFGELAETAGALAAENERLTRELGRKDADEAIAKPTFAVLGADGAPLVEGERG